MSVTENEILEKIVLWGVYCKFIVFGFFLYKLQKTLSTTETLLYNDPERLYVCTLKNTSGECLNIKIQ